MKDKLEVGHFIRTIKGIGRIEEITEDRTEIYFNCDTGLTISFIKKDFTQEEMAQYYKHSDNIIDLIEVGDVIKFDITDTDNYADIQGYNCWEISCEEELNGVKEMIEMESAKLISIVTREQFSAMEYRLGDDK